jgi:hypothetical protein
MKSSDAAITKETIDEKKEEFYEDLLDSFLDSVFGVESILSREDWEKAVIENQAYIFDPKQIR